MAYAINDKITNQPGNICSRDPDNCGNKLGLSCAKPSLAGVKPGVGINPRHRRIYLRDQGGPRPPLEGKNRI